MQLDLFAVSQGETIKNPLCIYSTHCGARATLGPEVDHGGCVNRSITCCQCGRVVGKQSTRKDL